MKKQRVENSDSSFQLAGENSENEAFSSHTPDIEDNISEPDEEQSVEGNYYPSLAFLILCLSARANKALSLQKMIILAKLQLLVLLLLISIVQLLPLSILTVITFLLSRLALFF